MDKKLYMCMPVNRVEPPSTPATVAPVPVTTKPVPPTPVEPKGEWVAAVARDGGGTLYAFAKSLANFNKRPTETIPMIDQFGNTYDYLLYDTLWRARVAASGLVGMYGEDIYFIYRINGVQHNISIPAQ